MDQSSYIPLAPASQPLGSTASSSSDGSELHLQSYPITPSSSDNPPPPLPDTRRSSSRSRMPRMSSMASIVSALSKRSSKASLRSYAPLSDTSPRKVAAGGAGLAPLRRTLARRASDRPPAPLAPSAPHEMGGGHGGVPEDRVSDTPSLHCKESSWKGNITKTMKRMSISRWNTRSISVDQGVTEPTTSSWLAPPNPSPAGDSFPSRLRASLDDGLPAPRSPGLNVDYPPSAQLSTFARPLSTISSHSSASEISTIVIIADPATLASAPSNRSIAEPLLPPSTSDDSVQSGGSTYYDAPSDLSPELSFDVFSPRVPPPPAPVIRGLVGNFSPISDLELPVAPSPLASSYPAPASHAASGPHAVLPGSRLPPQLVISTTKDPGTALPIDQETLISNADSRRPSEVILTPIEDSTPGGPGSVATESSEVVDPSQVTVSVVANELSETTALSPKSKPAPIILDSPAPTSPDASRASLDVPSPTRAIPTPTPSSFSTHIEPPTPRRTSTNASTSTSSTARPSAVSPVNRSFSIASFTSSMIRSPITGLPSPAPSTSPSVGFQWSQGTVLPYIPGLTPATMSVRPQIYPSPTPPSLITSPKSLVAPIREPPALPKPPGWEQSAFERALSRRGSAVLSRLSSPRGSYGDLTGLGIRATADPAPLAPIAPVEWRTSLNQRGRDEERR